MAAEPRYLYSHAVLIGQCLLVLVFLLSCGGGTWLEEALFHENTVLLVASWNRNRVKLQECGMPVAQVWFYLYSVFTEDKPHLPCLCNQSEHYVYKLYKIVYANCKDVLELMKQDFYLFFVHNKNKICIFLGLYASCCLIYNLSYIK